MKLMSRREAISTASAAAAATAMLPRRATPEPQKKVAAGERDEIKARYAAIFKV